MIGFSLTLTYGGALEAREVLAILAEDGRVAMPLQTPFRAEAFGMLVDCFGMPWIINGGMTSN
jgi:PhnB protein